LLQHIDYIVDRVGPDHIGLGSDIDGAQLPTAIATVERWDLLIGNFVRQGYDAELIEKITWKNWVRVISDTWEGSSNGD
jgi:membrane dipeptidase